MTIYTRMDVAVLALAEGDALKGCLRSLADQGIKPHVWLRSSDGMSSELDVEVHDGNGMSIPLRRSAALAHMKGDIVVLLEDTSWPEPGWRLAVERAFQDPLLGALGGPVRIDQGVSPRLRALGWTEYGAFTGVDAGASVRVPGNNMAFRRGALRLALSDGADEGLLEDEACRRLAGLGFKVRFDPGMAVTLARPAPAEARLTRRFQHGRLYGGGLARNRTQVKRLLLAIRCSVLPMVLTWRTLRQLHRSRIRWDWWAVPWIVVLHAAWTIGEMVGLARGRGRSLEAWR